MPLPSPSLSTLFVFKDSQGVIVAERVVDISSLQASPVLMKSWKAAVDSGANGRAFNGAGMLELMRQQFSLLRERDGTDAKSLELPNLPRDVATFLRAAEEAGVDLFAMDEEWATIDRMFEEPKA